MRTEKRPAPDAAMARTLREALKRVRLNKQGLAERTGVSVRTVTRWTSGVREPELPQLKSIVAALHALEPEVAEEVAGLKRQTLLSLGVVAPPAPSFELSPATIAAVDAALCSAAESLDSSPRALRPALLASLKRLLALGISVDLAVLVLERSESSSAPPALS